MGKSGTSIISFVPQAGGGGGNIVQHFRFPGGQGFC